MMKWIFYAGTYAAGGGRGIYRFAVDQDTGEMSKTELAFEMADTKYLASDGNLLAAAYGDGERAGVCMFREEQGRLTMLSRQDQGKAAPCYVTFLGGHLITANYHEGTVCIYRCENQKLQLEQSVFFGKGAGCHQVLAGHDVLLIPCLELDNICTLHLQGRMIPEGGIAFPSGSGPRHGIFHGDGTRLWVVGERDNRLYCFGAAANGRFCLEEKLEILPKGAPKDSLSAAIRLSPDGTFLTVSSRGADCLTTWRIENNGLEFVQRVSCGGRHPRDFIMTPDGRFLLSANRTDGEVVCFARNSESGQVGREIGRIRIPEVVSLIC